jgi:multidrug efflux system outer membrane protein
MTRFVRLDPRALAGVPLALLLASCMVGPGYQRPELAAPENHRTLTTAAEAESLADLPWWEVFQDTVLHDLINEALVSNHDLRIAAARVEEARARAGVAKSYLDPELNVTAGYGANQVSRESDPPQAAAGADRKYENWNASFVLSWEIDLFGRLRRQNESAMAVFMATDEARQGVVLTLVADVATSYFVLRTLDLDLEIARRTLELNDETVKLYRDRLQGGVSNKLEVNQAIATRSRTAAAIPELERQIAVQENLLSLLLGRNPGPIPRGTALTDQYLQPIVPAGLPSTLLDRRPDVRQAEQLLVSANADVGAAKALFYPTISLTGLFGASADLSNLADRQSQVWSIGAGLFQPLFQAGRIRRNYEAAQAAFEQALAQYAKTAQNAFREVADSLVAIDKLQLVRVEQEAGVAALQEASDLARARYDQGLSSYFEVLLADEQLFAAELDLANTRYSQLDAVVQLYRALGGGWQQPEPEEPPVE